MSERATNRSEKAVSPKGPVASERVADRSLSSAKAEAPSPARGAIIFNPM